MTDDLEARLRAADPVSSTDPAEWPPSRLAELTEKAMNEQAPKRERLWAVPAAAAAILALAVGGVAVAHHEGDDSGTKQTSVDTPMTLKLRSSAVGMGASCAVFSIDNLSGMPVAFSGTVARVAAGIVLIDVDHWYRGGSAAQVHLAFSEPSGMASEIAVGFIAGGRYLVTATRGVVNGCGFTTGWDPSTAAFFEQAFG